MSKIYLSVVIPSYDEMANLQKGVLDKLKHFLDKKKYKYEVLIVDDGSTDGSIEFVEQFIKDAPQLKLIKNSHVGKAGSVTRGILEALGEYILFTDMDQATPIEEVDKLLPYIEEGYDIVVGSRNTKRKGSPFIRNFISQANIILRKFIVGMYAITDTQCGFKLFKKEVAYGLFTKIKKIHHNFNTISGSSVSSGFDVELLHLALKMKYKIKEVPVYWLYVETRRVNPIKDSIEGLTDLIRIKIKSLQGVYDNV